MFRELQTSFDALVQAIERLPALMHILSDLLQSGRNCVEAFL
jgi:hypothetical protein